MDDVFVVTHVNDAPGPTIALIPGWLGSADSGYVLSVGNALWRAGFRVVRITLRDHGSTAHMNEGMFNSAMHEEVAKVVDHAVSGTEHGLGGVAGFSLGGNFALRVVRELPHLTGIAICPAIAPEATMHQIDRSVVYQKYFINKWRKIWQVKATAFPQYNFDDVLRLSTVSAITDYFVRHHTPFSSTDEYFKAYDLSGSALENVRAHVLCAQDDPIISVADFHNLPDTIELKVTQQGGHGAYIEGWDMASWVDDYVVDFFRRRFA